MGKHTNTHPIKAHIMAMMCEGRLRNIDFQSLWKCFIGKGMKEFRLRITKESNLGANCLSLTRLWSSYTKKSSVLGEINASRINSKVILLHLSCLLSAFVQTFCAQTFEKQAWDSNMVKKKIVISKLNLITLKPMSSANQF